MLRHLAARTAALLFASTLGVTAATSACSPSAGGKGVGDGNSGDLGGGSGGVSGTSSGGAIPLGGTGGSGGNLPQGGNGQGGGPDCAGTLVMGEPVPVDVYVMLDISGSMLAATGGPNNKWDSIKAAINAFLMDADSEGLGVAIQYFPLLAPGVPQSCTASADCGDRGPCLMKACARYVPGFAQCETDTDCDNALVKDDGPCEAGFCRLSGAACTDAASCQTRAAMVGPCVGLGRCQNDMANVCLEPGTLCSAMNPCVAIPSSVCVHETQCDQTSYATPAVEFGALPGAAAGIVASMTGQMPRGETPTRPALRGAIDHARAWTTSNPGHSVVVVLATDGLPTDCSNGNAIHPTSMAEVDEVVAVATDGLNAGISTFVVGIFAASDTMAPANLNRIAVAGGTNQAFMVDASSSAVDMQFAEALKAIRSSRLGCEFQIPAPPAGMTLDFNYVNVVLIDGAGMKNNLARVRGGLDRCAEVGGGWYYDVEPEDGLTPTRIIACPQTCGTITSTVNGQVSIQLDCRTVVL